MKITTQNTNRKVEEIILSAVTKYVNFISPTYGPAGKKTLISKSEYDCEAVDDGKRSSEAFELEDELENAVVQYIQETAKKGKDGTTTAVLLMGAIVTEAFKDLDDELRNSDYHGMALSLRRGMEEAIKKITSTVSKPVKTKEELYKVAYNSYKNRELAELIADTVFKVGKDGAIAIEDSHTTQTTVEVVNGLELNRGYASPYFITEKTEEVSLKNPSFLLVNKKINSLLEILELLTTLKATPQGSMRSFDSTSPVIIADGFGEDLLNRFIILKASGQLTPLLLEIPHGPNKLDTLNDIAIIVGAKVVDDKVLTLDKADKSILGSADSIVSTKDKTKVIGGHGKKADVKAYVENIKAQPADNPRLKDEQSRRVAKLSGGIAVIQLGAYTERELAGMKTKVENAVNSTLMAFRSGVVPGAGKTFDDLKTSSDLLNTALKAPRKQLEKNGAQYLDENTTDSTEVVTTALTTGVSIAAELINFGGISAIKREKKDKDF